MAKGDPNCRRQRFAWTLEGTTPPTLLAADQPLGLGLRQPLWVDADGHQVAAGCNGARAAELVLWPAPLEPWLPRRERRAARLPLPATACPPALPPPAAPLSIVGVREGDQLRRPAGSADPLLLKLSTLGGSGRRWWFLDGVPLTATTAEESFNQEFRRSGRHQLSVLDEAGQTARLEFAVTD
ncbi:Penicillin-binding protein 1C [compost metagenome]